METKNIFQTSVDQNVERLLLYMMIEEGKWKLVHFLRVFNPCNLNKSTLQEGY